MKHLLTTAIAIASLGALNAHAELDFYGKANVTFELASEGTEDHTQLQSNASRLGVKGSEPLTDTLTAVYQLEYQAEFDDGDTFSQRNIYVGLKGNFGSVIAGHFDTPLKKVQNKVDLFSDLHGDIKHVITYNENRKSNSVMYVSPELFDSVSVYVDYINSEDENVDPGTSLAVTYSAGDLYLAAAVDTDVEAEGSEAVRIVAQYTLDAFTFGLLFEQSEGATTDSESGWVASIKYKVTDKWTAKGQYGASDIQAEGGSTGSLGVDYRFTKAAKVFAFYTNQEADNVADFDNDYLGLGIEVKF